MNRDQFVLTNQNKEPVDASGKRIDPHQPASWMTRELATQEAARTGFEVAYVITADEPTACIDIDGCRDPITGVYDERAQRVFAALPGVGVEISRSERGLHFWFCCEAGMDERFMNRANGIEFYQSGRYIILGSHYQGDASIDATPYLPAILTPRDTTASDVPVSGPAPEYTGPSDDGLLIQMALGARGSVAGMFGDKARFVDLWNGDASLGKFFPTDTDDLFDRSAADAALLAHLAFWTGKDQERMQRLWLASPLAQGRTDQKKLQRGDYLTRSVSGAASKCQGVYSKPPLPGVPTAAPAPDATTNTTHGASGVPNEQTGGYLTMFDQDTHFEGCVYVEDEHKILAPDGALLKPEQFKVRFGGFEFQMQADGARPTKDAWECFTQSRCKRFPKVRHRRLMPNKPFGHIENDAVNVFKRPDWSSSEPVSDADVAPYLELVGKLLPDPNDRSVFLTWCAAMVQNPGMKFQWSIVLQGCEGNGKTFLLRCMEQAVGEYNTHFPNPEDMNEKFNTYLEGNLLIGVEEVHMAGRRDMLDRLKKYITNDRVEIRGMGTDKRMGDNLTNWIFCTNHKDAVIKTRNDRRYAILFTAQQVVEHLRRDGMVAGFFPALWDWARAGGFVKVAAWLHQMQLDERFNPAGTCNRAPQTTSTDLAISHSLGRLEQEIQEAIDEGVPGFRNGWISSIKLKERLNSARLDRLSHNAIRDALSNLGYDTVRCYVDGRAPPLAQEGGSRPRLYCTAETNKRATSVADYINDQGYNPPGENIRVVGS